MSRLVTPGNVYVEGESDKKILAVWFPHVQFDAVNGKDNVRKRCKQKTLSWGLLDRDFAEDWQVEESRLPQSRVFYLRRYCIENYLLEPAIIATVASNFQDRFPSLRIWSDEAYVAQQLLAWGKEIAVYAAANALISQWKEIVETDFRRYLGPLPPLSYNEVFVDLQARLSKLPKSEELQDLLSQKYAQVLHDVAHLEDLHRWINGKVILEDFLYMRVFNLHNFPQTRLFDELTQAGRYHIPTEFEELERHWAHANS